VDPQHPSTLTEQQAGRTEQRDEAVGLGDYDRLRELGGRLRVEVSICTAVLLAPVCTSTSTCIVCIVYMYYTYVVCTVCTV
jgi:hypothetical protein